MARKRKSRRKKKPLPPPLSGFGFDLGVYQRIMTVSEVEFNEALIEANVMGCSYGYDEIQGFPSPVPLISLVAEHEDKIRTAVESFKRWGCEQDGDVVGVALKFENNGTYKLAIGPDTIRRSHINTPNRQLVDPMYFGLSWVKPLDSTHPFLFEIARYAQQSFAPFILSFAKMRDMGNLVPENIVPIKGVPSILKHHLSVTWPDEDGRFFPSMFSSDQKEIKYREPKNSSPNHPNTVSTRRKKTIKIAFPITQHRLRLLDIYLEVRNILKADDIANEQIDQAAINCILSNELCSGGIHYKTLNGDIQKKIWGHIYERVELITRNHDFSWITPKMVAYQVELDVASTLSSVGIPVRGKKLSQLQRMFLRKGYVND